MTCGDGIVNEKGEKVRLHGTATALWKAQHTSAWTAFTRDDYVNWRGDPPASPGCQADEYPPAEFLKPGGKNTNGEHGSDDAQLVRYLPQIENGGAAHMWRGVCSGHDGGKNNHQFIKNDGEGRVNENLVKLKGKAREDTHRGHDGKMTTIVTWPKAVYTRAVFEMKFDWSAPNDPKEPHLKKPLVPSDENHWGLRDNHCWPKDIAENDPGFTLLTDDLFYGSMNPKPDTERYKDSPSPQLVEEANKKRAKAHLEAIDIDQSKGQKRPNSASGSNDPNKAPKIDPPSRKRGEIQVLDDGFAVVEGNVTRRLTSEEVRRDVKIVPCADKFCSRERAEVGRGESHLVIPASPPKLRPLKSVEAATTVAESNLATMETRTYARTTISPELPKVTG